LIRRRGENVRERLGILIRWRGENVREIRDSKLERESEWNILGILGGKMKRENRDYENAEF
jgi:hypothetical protein